MYKFSALFRATRFFANFSVKRDIFEKTLFTTLGNVIFHVPCKLQLIRLKIRSAGLEGLSVQYCEVNFQPNKLKFAGNMKNNIPEGGEKRFFKNFSIRPNDWRKNRVVLKRAQNLYNLLLTLNYWSPFENQLYFLFKCTEFQKNYSI